MDPDQPQFGRSYSNSRNSNSRRTNTNPSPNNSQQQQQQQQPQAQPFHEKSPKVPVPQLQSQAYPLNRPNLTTANRFNNMFSPQPRPTSPFSHNSPSSATTNNPTTTSANNTSTGTSKRISAASSPNSNINFLLPTQRHTPGSIEANVSYTRSFNSPRGTSNTTSINIRRDSLNITTPPLLSVNTPPSQISSQTHLQSQHQQHQQQSESQQSSKQQSQPPQPATDDEDARFLRLAREALVATAAGANPNGSALVDPTIQDLLTRLQYAASPHGNPIGRGSDITTNQKGQLNIQGFYEQFPNLSNDIFQGDQHHGEGQSQAAQTSSKSALTIPNRSNHPSSNNDGWNFLIGEPLTFKVAGTRYNKDTEISTSSSTNTNTSTTNTGSGNNRSHSIHGLSPIVHDNITGGTRSLSLGSAAAIRKQSLSDSDPIRKFLCEKCAMSFRRSSDLKRHEKQHLTIPPNICELCGKGFARKDALKRHMGTLTCKRNADKKLYIDNLNYLRDQKHHTPTDGDEDGDGEDQDDSLPSRADSGFDVSTF